MQVYLQRRLFLLFYRATAREFFPELCMSYITASHSIFLIWPHFYHKFLEKYIRLIFLPHFTTTTSGLYHSRYGFWQIHFRHLVLHMRLLCNMIVDIHCDLCIRMFFAPLRSVLNGCPPDIQHPITYCITLGLTLFSPSLVHPV